MHRREQTATAQGTQQSTHAASIRPLFLTTAAHHSPLSEDCIEKRKGPYQPEPAKAMWEELMAIKEKGDEVAYRAALLDTLQRFMHKGQLVKAEGIEGPCSHRNGRTGLILHNLQDEQGRFTIEFNDFKYDNSGELMQTWLRLPPTNIRLQVGMVPGLFGDFSYEKELVKKGKMKLPSAARRIGRSCPMRGGEG